MQKFVVHIAQDLLVPCKGTCKRRFRFFLSPNFTGDVLWYFFSPPLGKEGAVEVGAPDATELVAGTLSPGSEAVPQYSNQYSLPYHTGRYTQLQNQGN
jgi:hypothetical protein